MSETAASVIIADGDILVRHALADYLRHCGYTVIEAANSDEVVAVLNEKAVAVDILLCVAELGGALGGFGLGRWVREHRRDVDVEMAGSVAAAADKAADICEQGPHLARPYDPQSVVDRIKQLRANRDRGQRARGPVPTDRKTS